MTDTEFLHMRLEEAEGRRQVASGLSWLQLLRLRLRHARRSHDQH